MFNDEVDPASPVVFPFRIVQSPSLGSMSPPSDCAISKPNRSACSYLARFLLYIVELIFWNPESDEATVDVVKQILSIGTGNVASGFLFDNEAERKANRLRFYVIVTLGVMLGPESSDIFVFYRIHVLSSPLGSRRVF
jgi:hypothetical protein